EGQINLWRMDRRPEGEPLAIYGELLTLLSVEASAHEDGVTVNLLWSPNQTPDRDYTVSAFILGADNSFRNHDSMPLEGLSRTLSWNTDGLYFDSHFIPTDDLPTGEYQVGVAVYYFTDNTFTEIDNLVVDNCNDDSECRF